MQFGFLIPSQLIIHFSTTISLGLFFYQQLNSRFHVDFNVQHLHDDPIHFLIHYIYGDLNADKNATLAELGISKKTLKLTRKDPVVLFSHKYACGGGVVSTTAASLVSFPCAYEKLHSCCRKHDYCYDARLGQELCDDYFCNCLSSLNSEGGYCDLFTHYGLCMSTKLFGFWFYEHGKFNESAFENLGHEGQRLLDAYLTAGLQS